MHSSKLLKIKTVLENLLPSSIQLYNIIVCHLADDGVERQIEVIDDIHEDRIAMIVINKLESPKIIVSMFCTEDCQEELKDLLIKHIKWNRSHEFEVTFSKSNRFPKYCGKFFQGADEKHLEILREISEPEVNKNWMITVSIHKTEININQVSLSAFRRFVKL